MTERTMRVLDAQTATQHVATGSAAAGTGFAGSISLILVWGLGQLGVHLPAEVAAAIVAVLMTAAGVYAPKLAIAKLAAGFIDVPHVAADVVKGTVDGATKQVGGAVGAVAGAVGNAVGDAVGGVVGGVAGGVADAVHPQAAGPRRTPPAQPGVRVPPRRHPGQRNPARQQPGGGMIDVSAGVVPHGRHRGK
ncbi:hypothetical protein [Amycolatopsis sp. DSM 110486]|uniref:hypothetical protein n=1 Tax=Amycolatopsis sp. DSM 110486 TaxID=2865832 RepID=UPI001C6A5CFF|nr:hypothetical protein [Amycolatopsis sp. DSM 110486]QYN17625.1 hypothetical protein K1T34_33100 [Amycolatopsis sp. DSM 110486]